MKTSNTEIYVVATVFDAAAAVRERLTELGYPGHNYLLRDSKSQLAETHGLIIELTVMHEITSEILSVRVEFARATKKHPWEITSIHLLDLPKDTIRLVLLPEAGDELTYPVSIHTATWTQVAEGLWAWKADDSAITAFAVDEGGLWLRVSGYDSAKALTKVQYLALILEKSGDQLHAWAEQQMRDILDSYRAPKHVQVRQTSSTVAIRGVGNISTSYDVALLCCTGLVPACYTYTAYINGWHMPSLEGEGPWPVRGYTLAQARIEQEVRRRDNKPCYIYRLAGSEAQAAVFAANKRLSLLQREEKVWLALASSF